MRGWGQSICHWPFDNCHLSFQNQQLFSAGGSKMANNNCQMANDKWIALVHFAVSYLFFGMKFIESELRQ